jgi:diguanylate cyclase (GGDEF)-like protein
MAFEGAHRRSFFIIVGYFMFIKQKRLIILLATFLTTGFLFTSFIGYFTARESITTQVEKNTLPLTSDNVYSEIQRDLIPAIFISSMMAKDTFVRDWVLDGELDQDAIIRYLYEVQSQYGTITSFFVSEKSHKYYHSDGVLKTVSETDPDDAWYFRVKQMRQEYEINVDRDTANQQSLTIFVNHRIFDYAGNYIGAIGVGLDVHRVQNLIELYKKRYGRMVYFIDQQGTVVMHGSSYTGAESVQSSPELLPFAKTLLSSQSSSVTYEVDGTKLYLNSRFVSEFGWYLIVSQNENDEELRIQNTLMVNLGIGLLISFAIVFIVNIIVASHQRELESMATTDKLTGAANRQVFDLLFQQVASQSQRYHIPVSAIMFDVDHFKRINDTYGHPIGDKVLKNMAKAVQDSIRRTDTLFRWGGEEFLIVLPGSDLERARLVAEEIRLMVAELRVPYEGDKYIELSISLGVATQKLNESALELVNRADQLLYLAKNHGRNRVEFDIDQGAS